MDAILITEYIGIASAALSGYLFGVKEKCDWLGIFLAAFLTALGGGVARDVLVGRAIYSFTHYMPIVIVLVMIFVGYILKAHQKREKLDKSFIFIFTDAIDVICFSIVGSMVSLEYGLNIFGVIMVAFINGVGGGIFRDILLNQVPWFLKTGLYGTISMSVGFIYYILHLFGLTNLFALFVLMGFGILWRMVAYYKKWNLPPLR
ncbi:TRIC cation channel family protein [uncultured Campylobacter sp.]|uniref:trimeric intracellular cation channel family protein n=1 Tax=uncultured Campylobacter sp. TaxID=218934 RepID=UPI0026349093|nr:TRIC cation channel family protein [uncultured Campylobacter sp.]